MWVRECRWICWRLEFQIRAPSHPRNGGNVVVGVRSAHLRFSWFSSEQVQIKLKFQEASWHPAMAGARKNMAKGRGE